MLKDSGKEIIKLDVISYSCGDKNKFISSSFFHMHLILEMLFINAGAAH